MSDPTLADVGFALTPDMLEATKRTRTVEPQPGKYLDEVDTAVANPTTVYGITITEDRKESTIINQLHKSAKQKGVKLRVFVRKGKTAADGTVIPDFVGYQVKATDAAK